MSKLGRNSIEADARRLRVLQTNNPAPGSGTSDHGSLSGLDDYDHTWAIHKTTPGTITAIHTFSPSTPGPAFHLAANAQDQLISGLNADQLRGLTPTSTPGLAEYILQTDAAGTLALSSYLTVRAPTAGGIALFTQNAAGDNSFAIDHNADNPFIRMWDAVATERIRLRTDGNDSWIDSGGNLGIGTTTPSTLLDVAGSLKATSVEITTTLTVGDDILSDGFHYDDSLLAVGIGGKPVSLDPLASWPDPQFALDVNGSLRVWDYIIGKHALQIPDALHIWHFDGPLGKDNYSGVLESHRGLSPTNTNATFLPGKFGKALVRCRNAKNYVYNPIFELDLNRWNLVVPDDGTANDGWPYFQHNNEFAYIGTHSLLMAVKPGDRLYARPHLDGTSITISVPAGETIRWSAAIRKEYDGGYFWVGLYDTTNSAYRQSTAVANTLTAGEWQEFNAGWTNDTGAAADVYLIFWADHRSELDVNDYYLDAVQMTLSTGTIPSHHLPFIMGDFPDCAWYDPNNPHSSQSYRSPETLDYNIDPIVPVGTELGDITIMAWGKLYDTTETSNYLWYANGTNPTASNSWLILRVNNGAYQYYMGSYNAGPAALNDGQWHHYAVTYQRSTRQIRLYIDGENVDSATQTSDEVFISMGIPLYIGGPGASTVWNGLIDDFAIIDRTMNADELLSIYESNAPIFAETSTFSWSDPTMSIWANDEGLFAMANDGSGEAVFGIATKLTMWGSQTMDVGDMLLGNAAPGNANLFWDRSAGILDFRGGTTVQAFLDTNGNFVAGAGSVILNASGARILPTTEAGYSIDHAYKIGDSANPDMARWWLDDRGTSSRSRIEVESPNGTYLTYLWLEADNSANRFVEISRDLYVDNGIKTKIVQVGGTGAVGGSPYTLRFVQGISTPATSVPQLYRKSNELYVKDANGIETLISPHDENGEWIYLSHDTATGRRIKIRMEQLARAVQRLSGEQLIEEIIQQ